MTYSLRTILLFAVTALISSLTGCASNESATAPQSLASISTLKPGQFDTSEIQGAGYRAPGSRIEQQDASMWCWSACIQCVLRQAGKNASQAQITAVATGYPIDVPANGETVAAILNYYQMRAWAVNRPATPQELIASFQGGWKIIALINPAGGQVGHFVVLEGITPQGDMIVSDSMTGTTTIRPFNWVYAANWKMGVVVGRQ